ncbi:DinB family protein [Paenibacillus flagellatus]|uniref:DinB family protein n=1 Tax=Paenibacillus flagellatus TaxID=2211139 RepID=A0A2V5K9U2_9BACL|nr:DinB family protein [Paenibacillus flagellatus]PYI56299.1 DinB family protein [Paenibacillus flagellatus]
MSQSIIHTGKVLRQIMYGRLQDVPESQMDIQPEGFRNTVRWNIGHMVYWLDRYASLSFGSPSALPAHYETLFNSGTKPSDWTVTPPSKDELMAKVSDQLSGLSDLAPETLEQRLQSPFEMGPFQFVTAGELFNFAWIHEAIHLGVISSQLKLIK